MNRRDAIKALASVLGASATARLLAACGDNVSGEEAGIDTFVFMMMENRSYDHYLGSRSLLEGKRGDGLAAGMSNLDRGGNAIEPYAAAANSVCIIDPPHNWNRSREQFADGANSGFVTAHQDSHDSNSATEPMQYMTREHIPVTHALADAYTSCDRWFGSVLGGTLPNRMYWHGGQSNGAMENSEVLGGAFRGVTSIHHQLADAGMDWAYYYGDISVVSFLDDLDLDGHNKRFSRFLSDAEAGTLPPVSYIDPAFGLNDDHPPHHPLLGQQLIAAAYTALANSPHWERCLFVVTYDENGGFYDHVPPPTAADDLAADGFDQLGFRVPTIVAGPYVKQNYVSSVQYDHTSPLKHLKNVFGLPPLTTRSEAANDLTDCIDLERLAAGDPADPIVLPEVEIDAASLPPECDGSSLRQVPGAPLDHVILEWAEADRERSAPWDRTDELPQYAQTIADFLKKSRE